MSIIILPKEFQGIAESIPVKVTDEIKQLPRLDKKIAGVILHNLTVTDNPIPTNKPQVEEAMQTSALQYGGSGSSGTVAGTEIFYGFGALSRQLFAGQSSEFIPINDVSQIVVKCRENIEITIWYDIFY